VGLRGLTRGFTGKFEEKTLGGGRTLEVDPSYARKKRRMGHLLYRENQDFKNFGQATRSQERYNSPEPVSVQKIPAKLCLKESL
jgi:hypothetical protein